MLVLDNLVLVIIAVVTVLTGLFSLFRPKAVRGFTGLAADTPRATTEIRAILGGTFVGLGLVGPIFGMDGYRAMGFAYLVIAAARLFSMIVDRCWERSNVISLLTEIVLGAATFALT